MTGVKAGMTGVKAGTRVLRQPLLRGNDGRIVPCRVDLGNCPYGTSILSEGLTLKQFQYSPSDNRWEIDYGWSYCWAKKQSFS